MKITQKRFHLLTSLTFLLLALGVFLVPQEWLPETISHPKFYTFLLSFSALLIYLPPFIISHQNTPHKEHLVGHMQTAIAFSLILNNAGEFGLYSLYQYGFEYDKFCHFLVPMILAFIMAESLRTWEHFSRWKIVAITLPVVVAAGIFWEGLEFSSDYFLNTRIWGVYGQAVITDTLQDIVFDTVGAMAGILVFLIPSKREVRKRQKKH